MIPRDVRPTDGAISGHCLGAARARASFEKLLARPAWQADAACRERHRGQAGVGEICASATRAWWGTGKHLPTAKAAASFVGLNPSNWESGLTASPSRPITKEGPPAMRLAYYQAANVARRHDPALAAHYRTLMIERRHNHISANCAIARKLACRNWAVLHSGKPYELRDLDGNVVDWPTATAIAGSLAVPDDVRRRTRAQVTSKGRLSH